MSKYKTLSKNTLIFAIGDLSVKAIQFFLMPVFTFYLTASEFGKAEAVISLIEVSFPILSLGLTDAVFRFSMRDDEIKQPTVLSSSMLVMSIVALMFMLGSIVGVFVYNYKYVLTFSALYIVNSLSKVWGQYVRGKGKIATYAASGIARALALALFTYVFVVLLKLNAIGYLLSLIVSELASLFILLIFGKIINDLKIRYIDKKILKQMIIYALPLIPNGIFWWFLQVINRYIVINFISIAEAGLYVSVLKIAAIINILAVIFQQAWTISLIQTNNDEDKSDFNSKIFRFYATVVEIGGSALLILLEILSKFLLKGEFYSVWRFSSIAIFAAVISSFVAFYSGFFSATMKSKEILYSTMIGAVLNVVFCLLLVKYIGMQGAIYASIIGYTGMLIARMLFIKNDALIKYKVFKEIISISLLFGQSLFIVYSKDINRKLFYLIQIILFISLVLVRIKDIINVFQFFINTIKKLKNNKKEIE